VRAFRTAAATVATTADTELQARAAAGTLTELKGIGKVTATVITESLAGEEPVYLRRVQTLGGTPVSEGAAALRRALKGDLHTHSDWSDGGSPIEEMARAGRALGHEYMVLTDHSPRLTVANGLSAERLEQQLDVVAEVNERLAQEPGPPFRLLTGIECDINEDGSLDQDPAGPRPRAGRQGPAGERVRRRAGVRGVRAVRGGGGGEQPARAAGPAQAAAAAGPRGRVRRRDRHRRARAGAARLAAPGLRAGLPDGRDG
jgi:hypothetical protein